MYRIAFLLPFLAVLLQWQTVTDVSAQEPAVDADVVLQGATLHDGSGKPGVVGDIAIKGDRIVAMGKFKIAGKPRILNCEGLVISPGFIDLHTHSDYPLQKKPTNANYNYQTQGVTTVVTGNCGAGPVDVAKYFKTLETVGIGTNVLHQVPHNDVRREVMGNVNGARTGKELKELEDIVGKGMLDGAWGLAAGIL